MHLTTSINCCMIKSMHSNREKSLDLKWKMWPEDQNSEQKTEQTWKLAESLKSGRKFFYFNFLYFRETVLCCCPCQFVLVSFGLFVIVITLQSPHTGWFCPRFVEFSAQFAAVVCCAFNTLGFCKLLPKYLTVANGVCHPLLPCHWASRSIFHLAEILEILISDH